MIFKQVVFGSFHGKSHDSKFFQYSSPPCSMGAEISITIIWMVSVLSQISISTNLFFQGLLKVKQRWACSFLCGVDHLGMSYAADYLKPDNLTNPSLANNNLFSQFLDLYLFYLVWLGFFV